MSWFCNSSYVNLLSLGKLRKKLGPSVSKIFFKLADALNVLANNSFLNNSVASSESGTITRRKLSAALLKDLSVDSEAKFLIKLSKSLEFLIILPSLSEFVLNNALNSLAWTSVIVPPSNAFFISLSIDLPTAKYSS